MAHQIEYNKQTGTHSFYSRKEPAWHGLGQVVSEAKTSDEVLKIANLDFKVEKLPNYAYDKANNVYHKNDESFSTVRTDTKAVLGTVGTKYEILQNIEAFNFFDNIVGSKEAIYETAGVLYKGQKVFITAKLPDYIRLGNNDVIEQYLLLSNDHSGKSSLHIMFTPTRVVCNNTLTMALKGTANHYKIRHTKSLSDRMTDVTTMLGLHNVYIKELEEILNHMKSITLTEKSSKEIILKTVLNTNELELVSKYGKLNIDEISTRKKNVIHDMWDWTNQGVGQDTYQGTGLWLYNGVNGYFNNGKKYTSEENRFENIIGGTASETTNVIKNLILAY